MIRIDGLTYKYDANSKKPVLKDVNLELQEGKLYAILGNNGCGKSTLLKCIDGICKTEKNIEINGQVVDELSSNDRAKLVSFCPQNCHSNSLNVYDSIMLGRRPYIGFSASEEDKKAVNNAIKKFSLGNLADKPTNKLSGGEFQRVAIARIFAQDTQVMLLDEPTNNLDVKYQHVLMHHLQDAAADQNRLVICVLHDINMALTHADYLVFMKTGIIVNHCQPANVDKKLFKLVYNINVDVIENNGYKAIII